jgi:4-amino-4-deoxy-L-arabinose transferase-like glycosyltransferase
MGMINITKNIRVPENPYLLFSPFLLLYIALVLILNTNPFYDDEGIYIMQAQNLIHGSYSAQISEIYIYPGYSILLTPFVALHLPFLFIKLMNPVFQYLSVIFLFKALKHIVSFRIAFTFSLFWACYFNSFDYLHRMSSEIFTSFLIALLIFLLMRAFNRDKSIKGNKYIYLSGFILGYIILTKIIFGYVLLFMLIASGLLWFMNRKSVNYQISVLILLVAFAFTVPYLTYTYHLTGRIFYWGSTGGNNLYWMTSTYKGEYGNYLKDPQLNPDSVIWRSATPVSKTIGNIDVGYRNFYLPGTEDSVKLHHQKDFEEINQYAGIARDDAFKRIAIRNIKSHPVKFAQNCISNIGRILFNYPYSYKLQKPGLLLRFPLNMIMLVFMLTCSIPTLLNWRKIIFPIRFMLFFTLLYLGGSVLGSAEIRMFTIAVPMLLIWIAYILNKSVKFSLKFDENGNYQ